MREEKNKKSSRKVIPLTKKGWLYPAIYVIIAAVLVSTVLLYQAFLGTNETTKSPDTPNKPVVTNPTEPSVPASKQTEVLKKPVVDNTVEVQKGFYDDNGTAEAQEKALVKNGSTYATSTGIDYAAKDSQPFDVVSVLGGTVVKAEKDALLGYVVHVQHNDNVVSYYQSLGNIEVEVGMEVKQGQVLGQAGRNVWNKDAGVHVHFEIRKDGVAMNPDAFAGKTLADISKNIEIQKAEQSQPTSQQEEPKKSTSSVDGNSIMTDKNVDPNTQFEKQNQ